MLETRFKYYCRSDLGKDEHHRIADALVEDLMTNELAVLEAHLEYHKAQGFYGSKEMWNMIQRAQERIPDDIMQLFPIPDAIVHALLDSVA